MIDLKVIPGGRQYGTGDQRPGAHPAIWFWGLINLFIVTVIVLVAVW